MSDAIRWTLTALREQKSATQEEANALRFVNADRYDALAAELADLKRSREQERDYANVCYENEQLRAALRKYGTHTISCAALTGHFKGPERDCNCKWTSFLSSNFAAKTAAKPVWDCECGEVDCPYCANRAALTSAPKTMANKK